MGLSQLDAEAVLRRTSPYRSTAERLKTAKKPHKNEEIRRFLTDFLIIGNSFSAVGVCDKELGVGGMHPLRQTSIYQKKGVR